MTEPEWIATDALLERLPGSTRFKRGLVRHTFAGKKEIPKQIPYRQALALAAAADAQSRDVDRPARVFDLVLRSPGDLSGHLVVFFGRAGAPKLVDAATFEPQPATVIDLDFLAQLIREQE